MKYALKLVIGVLKSIVIGPLLSEATFVPAYGGNSNSLREIPDVKMIVLVNVSPEYCVVRIVLSEKPSKPIVVAFALRGCYS